MILMHLLLFNFRDKDQVVKLPILAHHSSPLCYIDLQVSCKENVRLILISNVIVTSCDDDCTVYLFSHGNRSNLYGYFVNCSYIVWSLCSNSFMSCKFLSLYMFSAVYNYWFPYYSVIKYMKYLLHHDSTYFHGHCPFWLILNVILKLIRVLNYAHDMPIFMQDIVNFEMFSSHLTNDEQQQLMKLLPSVDTSDAPYRCVLQLYSFMLHKSSMIAYHINWLSVYPIWNVFLSHGKFSNTRKNYKTSDQSLSLFSI